MQSNISHLLFILGLGSLPCLIWLHEITLHRFAAEAETRGHLIHFVLILCVCESKMFLKCLGDILLVEKRSISFLNGEKVAEKNFS